MPTTIGDQAGGEAGKGGIARPALLAAGQQSDLESGRSGEAAQGRLVLAGEDLGRRHQRGLRAAFDRGQHRHQRDKGLAAADIALQEAHHAAGLRQIGADLGDRHALGAGQCKTEPGLDLGGEPAGAGRDAAAAALAAGANQCDRELAGKYLVIGEALARRRRRRQIGLARRGVGLPQSLGPGRPLTPAHQAAVDPFREIWNPFERRRGGALDDARSET